MHFAYARAFTDAFPGVPVHPERVLVIAGKREDLITSGASMTWHDLVALPDCPPCRRDRSARGGAVLALQWHRDGLAPYMVFEGAGITAIPPCRSHRIGLRPISSVVNPLDEMIRRAGLAERTFKRRFTATTGLSPIVYVQRLRIEEAKRRLERTEASVDEISWKVGYEEPAFFRRLFKRVTGLAPEHYRRRFRIPDYAQSPRKERSPGLMELGGFP